MARALKRKRKPAMNTESEGEAEQLLPAKKFRSPYRDLVTVLVGDDTFIHRQPLCDRSQHIKKLLAETAEPKTIKLDDVESEIFDVYVAWLYSDQSSSDTAGVRSTDPSKMKGLASIMSKAPAPYGPMDCMISLWLLGVLLDDVRFTNQVMDQILAYRVHHVHLISMAGMQNIVKEAKPDSGLRRWLVDHIAAVASPAKYDELEASLPADVRSAVLKRSLAMRGRSAQESTPTMLKKADYYQREQ